MNKEDWIVRNWLHDEMPEKDHYGEYCKDKITVPGQAYTVKELVERIRSGRPVIKEV